MMFDVSEKCPIDILPPDIFLGQYCGILLHIPL
jgi:hypothetical protein